jgi:hypothetical protein
LPRACNSTHSAAQVRQAQVRQVRQTARALVANHRADRNARGLSARL